MAGFELEKMKVDELLDVLTRLTQDEEETMGEYDIAVCFRWKGDTVFSNITSWCINGRSIQLNEEDFDVEMRRVRQGARPHFLKTGEEI